MANSTKCLTPGAIFSTHISSSENTVSVKVQLPEGSITDITEEEAEVLETLLHNQLEIVLRNYCKPESEHIDPREGNPQFDPMTNHYKYTDPLASNPATDPWVKHYLDYSW